MPADSGAAVRPYSASPLLGCATWSVGRFAQRTIEQCSPSCSTTASAQQYGARASAQVVRWASHSSYIFVRTEALPARLSSLNSYSFYFEQNERSDAEERRI